MAQSKILLDTNAYLRLAQNIHPLLFETFGDEDYTLYVHSDLRSELKRSSRLRNSFGWVFESAYEENRKKPISSSKAQKKEMELNFDYLWQAALAMERQPSEIDTKILSMGLAMGIPVVTDDVPMATLAEEFEVEAWNSLELMKKMVDAEHITMDKVELVVEQWQYDNDLPARTIWDRYEEIFGEEPPRF